MEGDYQHIKVKNVKVSTTLFNNTAEYGKQLMFDYKDDTCWNSAEGKMQYIFVVFDELTKISKIEITCQGGFCPKVFFSLIYMKLRYRIQRLMNLITKNQS
jgi:hypothetical protein